MNTESTIPTQAPDWQVVAHDVTCPMCDYNLRGLATIIASQVIVALGVCTALVRFL